jgi:hypothetical protein
LFSRIALNTTAITTVDEETLDADSGGGGAHAGTMSPIGATPVLAGTTNVTLQAEECGGGMAFVGQKSITTIFEPFGDAGNAGSLSRPTGVASSPFQANQPQ